jgi:hypothetical protein
MSRHTSNALTVLLVLALVAFVLAQVWVLPNGVHDVVAEFPEVAWLAVPGIVWGVAAVACWQAIAIVGLRIVRLARDHRFTESGRGPLRAVLGCLLAFLALVIAAFIALTVLNYATPGAMLGLIVSGLVAGIAAVRLGMHLGATSAVPRAPTPTTRESPSRPA